MTGGRRAGQRPKARFRADLLGIALGITFALVAWGYLVIAAIDFGAQARHEDDSKAWALLAVASIGAMLCLFLAFLLATRFSRAAGLSVAPSPRPKRDKDLPKGGRRAAR